MKIGYTQILTKSISHVTAVPVQSLGDRVIADGEEYIYCYAKTTCPVGYAVQVSASTGYSVTLSATALTNLPLGVVKHVDIPTSEYGWVCSRGHVPSVGGLNTTLDVLNHVIMVVTTNTGNMGRVGLGATVYSQSALPVPFGIVCVACETAGSGGNADVYINC